MNNKILYIKSLAPRLYTTEEIALSVLNDEKYDNNPLINKEAIIRAFNMFEKDLNPLNKEVIPKLTSINANIEGNFLATNIPEINSKVIDEPCSIERLYEILDEDGDITHIGLSTYAFGMENTIEMIKSIQHDFSHLELFVGGIGTVYPHIQDLVPPKNLCIGEGVNWIRKKFDLKTLKADEFKIPKIYGNLTNIPLSIKAAYIVSQLGCPNNCDFCITPNFYNYLPFANTEKIINFIENLIEDPGKDIFIYLCDPNGFYPEKAWNKVFNYFIEHYSNLNKNIFLMGLASLYHINKFDIEMIQKKSPIKLLGINYGIESTLHGGYQKNRNIEGKVINRLNVNGIITFHTCILGLPIHTPENISLDIKNNCKLKSDVISFNTFKPIPQTQIFQELKTQNRLFIDKLSPEFLYMEGYMPFKHQNLGFGFDILPYAFEAYYESEKRLIDVFSNIANKLLDLYSISGSSKLRTASNILIELSKMNFESFKARMPINLTNLYQNRINNLVDKTIMLKKK